MTNDCGTFAGGRDVRTSSFVIRHSFIPRSFTSGRGGLTITLWSHRTDTCFLLSQGSLPHAHPVSLDSESAGSLE